MKYLGQFSNDNDIVKKSDINSKMNTTNPTGTGSLSLNRKSNTTIGSYSVAEGLETTASGNSSHAEGSSTTASGIYSHAEGSFTTASGNGSHTEGFRTIAQRKSQHTFGEFNIADTSGVDETQRGTYVEIVGNGTADNTRSNARTLDWDGNEALSGNIIVKGGKIGDGNNANYKLVIPTTTSWTADKTIATTDQIPTSDSNLTNDRYVRYDTASQGLNSTQQSNARTNIGAGTSNFSGSYNDLTNKPTFMDYIGSSAYTGVGTTYGQGYIDYKISSTQKIRHAFGLANCNASLTFDVPFTTLLWANASDASTSDAQSQRTTIKTMSTTGLTFYGGGNFGVRWEAWGIINI